VINFRPSITDQFSVAVDSTGEPYDGVAEIWIDLDATTEDPQAMAAAMQRLLEDELTFVDMARSSVFIAEEQVIF
jgi:hypothetical protein